MLPDVFSPRHGFKAYKVDKSNFSNPANVIPDATFIQLGGDSVRALQLTFKLDDLGIPLELESVLNKENSIQGLSQILEPEQGSRESDKPKNVTNGSDSQIRDQPFTLVQSNDVERIIQEAKEQIGCSKTDIEDILPMTSQQRLLWLGSLQKPGAYIAHWSFKLSDWVDVEQLREAWMKVLENSSVLRVRIVLDTDDTLYQAIVATHLYDQPWSTGKDEFSSGVVSDYGQPLVRYGIENLKDGKMFQLHAHHALYDRWSMNLIFDDVRRVYHSLASLVPRPSFIPYLEPLAADERDALIKKWQAFIGDSSTPAPQVAASESPAFASTKCERSIMLPSCSATKAELITAAWSWVCSKQCGSADISFGLTLWGRDISLPGVSEMAFPTFSTLPICVQLEPSDSVSVFLSKIKTTLSTLRGIQRLGFDEISSINDISRRVCHFNSIVVVQAERMLHSDVNKIFGQHDLVSFDVRQSHHLVVECTPNKTSIDFSLNYDPSYLPTEAAEPLLSHLCLAVETFAAGEAKMCAEITLFGVEDESCVRKWTNPCEDPQKGKIYSLIEQSARTSPDSIAIWTTNSTITYRQLDDKALNLAQVLKAKGAEKHVGVCIEKSSLAVIAQIGVSMAGCAFVPVDPENPSSRIMQIIQNSDMSLLVCSPSLASRFESCPVPVFVLDDASLSESDRTEEEKMDRMKDSSNPAYLLYTSGSTGTPKGVVISHEAILTSMAAMKRFVGLDTTIRTLQFSSFAFDMSIYEIYVTLSAGGTLCIPTDAERFELDDFISRAKPNHCVLTPSVAVTLTDESVAQLSKFGLGGEALTKGLLEKAFAVGSQPWNLFGPTEASMATMGNEFSSASISPTNLGHSFGSTAWIVDIEDPNRLAPVGMPGELAFSGHTLASEYYKDTEKTEKTFRRGLQWTEKFPEHPLERVYLSGDMGRYEPDGTIEFLGRIGGYTKIGGHRVDLAEIEYALIHECDMTDVTVQICQINGEHSRRDMTLCFFVDPSSKSKNANTCNLLDYTSETRLKASKASTSLADCVPTYMLPSAYIPVNVLPLNTTRKLNTRRLRELVETLDTESLLARYGLDGVAEKLETPVNGGVPEQKLTVLKDAWQAVLSVAGSTLTSNSNFFRRGGDSLRAMKLAGALRRSGYSLLVADIFNSPVLRQMADKVQQRSKVVSNDQMFSAAEYEELIKSAAGNLRISRDQIESLSVCSSLQEQMLVASEQSQGSFLHRECFELESGISHEEVSNVCSALVDQNELLRTMMFIDGQSGRFFQAVMKPGTTFKLLEEKATLEQYLNAKPASAMGLGTNLCRFVLLNTDGGTQVLVWEMNHSIYDGHSAALLLNRIQALIEQYRRQKPGDKALEVTSSAPRFETFIQYLSTTDKKESREFWSQYLEGVQVPSFNIIRPVPAQSITNERVIRKVPLQWKESAFTAATYIRAAFALLLSRYAASTDVNFAATVSGRDLPVNGIEDIAGPTFSTIPVRVRTEPKEPLQALLARVQEDTATCGSHQTLSTEEIGQISSHCKQACQFKSHLLIQSGDTKPHHEALSSLGYRVVESSPVHLQIPFNLVVTAKQAGISMEAIYNDAAINSAEVELFIDQMGALLQQFLMAREDTTIESVMCLGKKNQQIIMSLQPEPKEQPPPSTITDLVFRDMNDKADREAIYSTEISLTYREVHELSQRISREIGEKVQGSNQMIVFCFQKSPWAIIAQLAILLAGHCYVPIDPAWPETRRDSVLQQTQPSLVVTSPSLLDTFSGLDIDILALDMDAKNTHFQDGRNCLPQPSDLAYVLFTSGSTGSPKGVICEHGPITRTMQTYAKKLDFTVNTRALLFASFTFDISFLETWPVLAVGGTLCVANDEERISDLSAFIEKSGSNKASFTPTASRLVESRALCNLETLLLCGEKCRESDLKELRASDTVLVNGYGPTEASVYSALNIGFRETDLDDIGTSTGGGLWIANPNNFNDILPVGCTGELLISGPILAREYLNSPEMTASRFVYPKWPEWTNTKGERAYKTGDLARIDAHGRIHFVGRNDGQMKINGIRIEAEEIEHAAQSSTDKVKAVIASTFSHDSDNTELALYFVSSEESTGSENYQILPLAEGHPEIVSALDSAIRNSLPGAYAPSVYIPISRIPFTTAGKADRKLLSITTLRLHPSQLNLYRPGNEAEFSASTQPSNSQNTTSPETSLSETETTLKSLWATAIHSRSATANLTPDSHFIESGGDSVAAIRLSSVAKSKGITLPVRAIYAYPRLRDMAIAMENQRDVKDTEIQGVTSPEAFEMLDEMDFVSPMSNGSPETTRKRGGDYFGSL